MLPFNESGLTRIKNSMIFIANTMIGIPFNSRVFITIKLQRCRNNESNDTLLLLEFSMISSRRSK